MSGYRVPSITLPHEPRTMTISFEQYLLHRLGTYIRAHTLFFLQLTAINYLHELLEQDFSPKSYFDTQSLEKDTKNPTYLKNFVGRNYQLYVVMN